LGNTAGHIGAGIGIELAGVGSWRFAVDVNEMVHVALYVRDALGLDVEAAPNRPPALAGGVPAGPDVLNDAERGEAAAQWPAWWEAVLADATHQNQGPPDRADMDAWMRELHVRGLRTGSPPEFAGLMDRPALRKALIALTPEACRWAEGPRRAAHPPAGRATFASELIREVAEDVAFDRGVAVQAVRAVALVLAVEGSWWVCHRPGVVLCSVSAPEDPVTARTILRAAFESGLAPSR
jgi:hypothetical protein